MHTTAYLQLASDMALLPSAPWMAKEGQPVSKTGYVA